MDPRKLGMHLDERLVGVCAYCGSVPNTKDHVPSKVLLDLPFPEQLECVDACSMCNVSFSQDEEYFACFLECVICGTTDPNGVSRANISRILRDKVSLRNRIEAAKLVSKDGSLFWEYEVERVKNVVIKLAQGHSAFWNVPIYDDPCSVSVTPLLTMETRERMLFEAGACEPTRMFPEIGSRAFVSMFLVNDGNVNSFFKEDWVVVQEGRYRYALRSDWQEVRIVLSEYLACSVYWE